MTAKNLERQAASALTETTAFSQPPYGYINAAFRRDLNLRLPPDRFRVNGRQGTLKEWNDLVEAEVTAMADFLWPIRKGGTWHGQATATADALTRADLELMGTSGLGSLLLEKVAGRGQAASSVTHKQMFEVEDLGQPGERYEVYDKEVDEALLTKLRGSMTKALASFGPAPLHYKEYFQRAHPYQMAWSLDLPFAYEWAKSAVTPALISGHAIQGALACTSAFVENKRAIESIAGAATFLRRLTVDFGDRRVFAGAHFPSDNLASWYCLAGLIEHLFPEGAVKDAISFLWGAIYGESKVFAAMTEHAKKHGKGSPFSVPIERLKDRIPQGVQDEVAQQIAAREDTRSAALDAIADLLASRGAA